jgi:hypothetical protein
MKDDRMDWACSTHEDEKLVHNFSRNAEREILLWTYRHIWEDKIKIALKNRI